nr:Chain Q, Mitogen-activated protein kinase kinase 1 [Arabidopsis thaliana]
IHRDLKPSNLLIN